MITVKIINSNMDFFDQYELSERISYVDFQEISTNMLVGEYIQFELFNEKSEEALPFYKGRFEKNGENSVTEDIFSVLEQTRSQKGITKKQEKEIKQEITSQLKVGVTKEKKSKKTSKKIYTQIREAIPIKKIGVAFLVGITLLLVVITATYFITQATVPKVETYNELILKGDYESAVKNYPDKLEEVEASIFEKIQKEETNSQELESFQKKYPTKQGEFDLEMFAYNYQEAIQVYEKNEKSFTNDSTRMLLVGYSYLKINKLQEAEKVQEKINNAELGKYIQQYKQYDLIIKEKQKEIEELQKKPTENKEKIEKAIEELYKAKKQLNDL